MNKDCEGRGGGGSREGRDLDEREREGLSGREMLMREGREDGKVKKRNWEINDA